MAGLKWYLPKLRKTKIRASWGGGESNDEHIRNRMGRFHELASSVGEELRGVRQTALLLEGDDRGGRIDVLNPRAVIKARADMREGIWKAREGWTELDDLRRAEVEKRRSKLSDDDLESRGTIVQKLKAEIELLEGALKAGRFTSGGREGGSTAAAVPDMLSLTIAGSGDPVKVTEKQRQQLEQVQDQNSELDRQLDELDEVINDLQEIGKMQREEIIGQNSALNRLSENFDGLGDRGNRASKGIHKIMKRL